MTVEAEQAFSGAGWDSGYALPPARRFRFVMAPILAVLGLAAACLATRLISGAAAQAVALAAFGLAAGAAVLVAARQRNAPLRARSGMLCEALDAAAEGVLIATPEDGAVFSNLAFDRLFPLSRDGPLRRVERALAADRESQAELRRLRSRAAAGAPATAAIDFQHPCAGTARRFRVSVDPMAGRRGRSLWRFAEIAGDNPAPGGDVENAGTCPLETYSWLFANAPLGIALIDRRGCFEKANSAVAELFGAAPQELIGCELTALLREEDRAAIAGVLDAALAGQAVREPVEIRLGLPHERTLVLLLSPLGQIGTESLALHFIDVTERKNLEAQFAQSQKMQAVGQLAGGVAHDFNNLLTAIIGFCDLLLLRSRPGDPAFGDINQIKQNANRAGNLVRQLLAFSRQQPLQPRVLDVTDVLFELSHMLRRLIGENIELEVVHARELGLAMVDQGQLEQVIINLAVNARDAMPHGGRLTIRTANLAQREPLRRGHETMPAGEYVAIDVGDTGTGIAADHLPRIFEPFFSTKEAGSGTGLGLSTAYGIVRQTGGFVFVDSVPGRGTQFRICLPRCEAAALPRVARPDAADAPPMRDLTGSGTLMLVEDDDPVRIFSARALRNKGYRVLEADSAGAALELLARTAQPIDLLITDVAMPQMDGPALVREVRGIDPKIKVVFISGYAEDAFRQRLDSDRDIHFLAKPFSLKQLAIKVKEVMENGRA